MPINPYDRIDKPVLRDGYEKDLTIPDTGDILTKYPINLGVGGSEKENVQAILFKFHNPIPGQIEPENPNLQGNNRYVALPLPAELPFSDTYSYDDSSLQSYGTWIKNMLARAGQNIGSLTGGETADSGNRRLGQTPNSQAALTFNNPIFRTFTFSWELVAKDEAEAGAIHSIIQKFRIGAASTFQGGDSKSAYIKYPDLVSFIIYPGNNRFPFPASYPCFIESVTYPPLSADGQIPFFHDSAPVGWKLTLVLKESMYLDKIEIAPGWGQQGF